MIKELYTNIFEYFCKKSSEENLKEINMPGIKSITNIRYGKDAKNNVFDIHFPLDGKRHPTILLIHGGGYVAGEKQDLNRYIQELLKYNYCIINMEYSLCGSKSNIHMPKQIYEVFDLFKFLQKHPEIAQAIDYNNFFIGGNSAGAHFAALVANIQTNDGLKYEFNLCGGPRIKGGIYICPVFGNFKFHGMYPKRQLEEFLYGNDEIGEVCHNLDIISSSFPPSIVFSTPNDIISKSHFKNFNKRAAENFLPARLIMVKSGYKLFHNTIAHHADKYPTSMREIAKFVEDCKNETIVRTVEYKEISEPTIFEESEQEAK